ncbi:C10 family peptidase, partial [Candidatus Bipolaricaulota bacterium]|nr:C10 family peptidase [Candidatus Bipolaricaulota bacterium]
MRMLLCAALALALTIGGLGVSGWGQNDWSGEVWSDMAPGFVISNVDEFDATDAAQYYVYESPPPALAAAVAAGAQLVLPPRPFPSAEIKVAWVFDLTGPGFVITSAHTDLEPLIAYSTESEFPWGRDPENSFRQVLLLDLALRILGRSASQGACDVPLYQQMWGPFVGARFGPVLASLSYLTTGRSTYSGPDPIIAFVNDWHQDAPCNSRCAGDKVGCVPLAMAQIICHHQHPDLSSV